MQKCFSKGNSIHGEGIILKCFHDHTLCLEYTVHFGSYTVTLLATWENSITNVEDMDLLPRC